MSHPSNPPPYEEIYNQGVRTHPPPAYPGSTYPVPVHPLQMNAQNHQTQPVIVQTQSQMILHVPVHQQPTRRPVVIENAVETAVESAHIICPSCNCPVRTKTEIRPGLQTHLCAACLLITGFIPCCLIPYCIPNCNNVDHYCPNCNAYIGSYTS